MKFSTKITKWYVANKRNLPWRVTTDPYKIWLSEIILQQTRINQGTDYYLKFVKNYPEINSLAKSQEQDILKLWQGLGYYSRGRNLHKTARIIMQKYNGKFPENYKDIIELPGIGEYTAAAICSISYGLPYPVIDGNVIRVLSRIYGILTQTNSGNGKKEIKQLAANLINKRDPGTYNQAIMEFGALYCKPQNPDCKNCILKKECFAFQKNRVSELPIKQKPISHKKRYFNYLVMRIIDNDKVYTILNKRRQKDIWQNLYDFPCIETNTKISKVKVIDELKTTFLGNQNISLTPGKEYKHVLTHQLIYARFYEATIQQGYLNKEDIQQLLDIFIKIQIDDFSKYPVSRLIEKVINETQFLK